MFGSKTEADDLLSIGISWLKKEGIFYRWHNRTITWTFGVNKNSVGIIVNLDCSSPYIALNYSVTDRGTGEKRPFNYKVWLASTPCNFGGKRWWFICPLVKEGRACNRRVGKIYMNGDYFGCRHCYELTYRSRKVNRRNQWYWAMRVLDIDFKADEIEKSIKRRYYAGKPTRKLRQLYKLYDRSSGEYNKMKLEQLR